MPISLNALLNVPTREEKERKEARNQAKVDRISEMEFADEIAKRQMEFDKQLGLEFEKKKADAAAQRAIKALRNAGDPTPEVTFAKSLSSTLYADETKTDQYRKGKELGLPSRLVAKEAAAADEAVGTSLLNQERNAGMYPLARLAGETAAEKDISGNVVARQANDRMFELGPLSGQAEAAELMAKRDAARNYVGGYEQRNLQNAAGLLEAQMRQEYLRKLVNDPLQLNLMMNPRLSPADFGKGTAPQLLMNPMAPLGQPQTPAVQPQSTLGAPPANANRLTLEQQYDRLRQIMQQNPVKVKPQE